ncbi:rhamnan synthesis F family protein [Brucella intermedia]|uniref:rhamnosyltransferase WsaF family glycosyltransferase n=1 Tax=Brucella intermedia TaxID=94625 RepID=UPI0009896B9F|nr:rhamnan synthesis F family protein [Brucella intermedia]OOC49698.1 hypothetical protein AS855_13715 [Brucella intermedia M86]
MYYALRAYRILKTRGIKALTLHSIRFVRYKLNLSNRINFMRGELDFAGTVGMNGVLSARTIPDSINPPMCIPLSGQKVDIIFDKVAVIAHIFYPELTKEILTYIKNIPIPTGLFITTDSYHKRKEIEDVFIESGLDVLEFEVRVTPNRGRDIAPKYVGFRDVYVKYDAFLHIHSKKSLHAKGLGSIWRKYLFESLVGSKEIAESNLALLSLDNVGIVYPEHIDLVKKDINWGYDFPIVKAILRKMGVILDSKIILEFPSGSMFWGRSKAIQPILDMNLAFSDFPEEMGQIDGTLAHGIERALLFIAEKTGHSWVRVTTRAPYKGAPDLENITFIPLLGSERMAVGLTSSSIGETLRILAAPEQVERPRLNLMLHTVHPAAIFGGIDTALKIFSDMVAAVDKDIDVRIIVSEALVSDVPGSLNEYMVQNIGYEEPASRVILDATDRIDKYLNVRPNDIFVATAWWTASNAFQLHDMQKSFFGSAPKVVYLIQDFEPGFYGWSTKFALAESTYLRGQDTVALINSEELLHYLERKYKLPDKMVIPYKPNSKIDTMLSSLRREKIVLFYARPSALRNCFEAGVDAISLWGRRNPMQANEWKIFCIGENFDSRLVEHIPNCTITGKMPLEDYANLLSRASVGVSLMISPHPSYPPLEMAYAGIQTITNRYENKDLTERSDFIRSVDVPTPEMIADALQEAVDYAQISMVGRCTPIRNKIKSIGTEASVYNVKRLIENIGLC